jgi:Skp family chaperone for outer membrane proteins
VKRTILTLGLVAVAFAASGRAAHAQQVAAPLGQLRVAVVNMGLVFTKYEKAAAVKNQLERSLEPYKQEAEKLKKDMLSWAEYMKSPNFPAKDKDQYENGIRTNQRKLEDIEVQVRKMVGKQQEDQIINLYKEINEAIKVCAQQQGIQVVFGYGEQTEGDVYSISNITRKMQGMDMGGCNPLYCQPDVDISRYLIQYLNTNFQRMAATPAGVTQTSGTVPLGTIPAGKKN